jgi:phage baseplate assembly protein W
MALTDAERFGTDLDLPMVDEDELLISPTGDLRTRAGRTNLRGALTQRALTGRGELLHRPAYGGGLPDGVELPNTPAQRGEMASRLRANALRDSRVREVTVGVAAGVNDDPNRAGMTLTISYTTALDGTEGESLSVDLTE